MSILATLETKRNSALDSFTPTLWLTVETIEAALSNGTKHNLLSGLISLRQSQNKPKPVFTFHSQGIGFYVYDAIFHQIPHLFLSKAINFVAISVYCHDSCSKIDGILVHRYKTYHVPGFHYIVVCCRRPVALQSSNEV